MEFKNSKITVVSPAKINLHLEVLGKRKDGYHELAMLMQSISLEDYLEIEPNTYGVINLSSNNNNKILIKVYPKRTFSTLWQHYMSR